MPEGDAVWRTARRLHGALSGQVLLGADLRVPALATKDLSGRTTVEVVPRGKHLLHRLEGGLTLHSHLRMDGSWRVRTAPEGTAYVGGVAPGGPGTQRHTVRAVLWSAQHLAIGESLGMLDLVETTHEERLVGHLGPDLLDRDFDRQRALSNLAAQPGRAVAEALLDQRNLAGIGTIYASEPLFEHRVSPWTPLGLLPPEVLGGVVDTARLWLVRSCRIGPTAARDPRTLLPPDGWLPGRYRVFGRRGRPCPRCGTTIQEQPIGAAPRERVISFCPQCQA